ncbi:MAG: hypothetical protein LBI31_01775 [Zoogloeaceae bacterium]|jgi:hypothetical protein|nr:hypothetical protein [Zoogloeaceae bacterium]
MTKKSNSSMTQKQDSPDEKPLLEEICDLDTLFREEHKHDAEVQAKALRKWDDTLAYPDLNDQFVPRIATKGQTRSGQLSPESRPARFSSSVLDSLQAQSRTLLSEQERQRQEAARMSADLDASLRRIFPFLDELTRQLNILKPPISRAYPLVHGHEFKNLVWQTGRVDYRSASLHTSTAEMESVTLTYRLASEEPPLCLERERGSADSFHQRLFDCGLLFTSDKIFSEGKALLGTRFMIKPEIKVHVVWRCNPEDGRLRCEAHNLERLGRQTWLLPVDAPMDARLLDEFGRLVLGQKHDFPYILNRTQAT